MNKLFFIIYRLYRHYVKFPTNTRLYSSYALKYIVWANHNYTYWSRERDCFIIFNSESDMLVWDLEIPPFVHKKDKDSFYHKNSVTFAKQKELKRMVK